MQPKQDPKPNPQEAESDPAEFFGSIKKKLANDQTPDILLSIPTWGWPGDGKTCAILTAIHFCDLQKHGLSLARITDTDELTTLEDTTNAYRGMGLAALADSTAARLGELNSTFLDQNHWPPGTDIATQYLLELRTATGRKAYILFPDLRGGSYQSPDNANRTVLRGAHAQIILVNAGRFVEPTTTGKEYKDAVIGRIQRCAQQKIPTCIMLSQCDRMEEAAVDETEKQLAILITDTQCPAKMFRTSVVNDAAIADSEDPPPLKDRHPDHLVRAWVWILAEALTRPVVEIKASVPAINLEEGGRKPMMRLNSVRELRLVREESKSSGNVLCPLPAAQGAKFLFLAKDGATLSEVTIDLEGAKHSAKPLGAIEDWASTSPVQARVRDGSIFLGSATNAQVIWHANQGQTLRKTTLPYALLTWTPVTDKLLAGLDEKGTIHLFRSNDTKWSDAGYITPFLPGSPLLACGYVPAQHLILVAHAKGCVGVEVTGNGTLGNRVDVPVPVSFQQPLAKISLQGYVAGVGEGNSVVAGREKPHKLGECHANAFSLVSLADDAPIVAWISPQQTLLAATLAGDKPQVTAADKGIPLQEIPNALAWSPTGSVLAISYASGHWAWAKPFGF